MRSPILLCGTPGGFFALPPSEERDVAEEARVAASLFRPSSVPLFKPVFEDETRSKEIVLVVVDDGQRYSQLVAELISDITTGSRAGTSWLRPLAMRLSENATLARAAHAYDATLGWLNAEVEREEAEAVVPAVVHVFSPIVPAAFVQTEFLDRSVPPALAVAVRSMNDAHAAAASDALVHDAGEASLMAADAAALRNFMNMLAWWNEPPQSRPKLFDPLA